MTPEEPVRRAAAGAGWLRRPGRSVLSVTGADRERWLDGMVTNDVRALRPDGADAACRALLLTPQGRIVGDLVIHARSDAYLLELADGVRDAVRDRLSKYVIADDVELSDASAAFAHFQVEGPSAASVVEAVLGRRPEAAPWACTAGTGAAADVVAIARSLTGLAGFHLWSAAAAAGAVETALAEHEEAGDAVALTPETLEVLRVEGGVPRQGAEIDDSVLPAEVRLDEAVSETKGCYTGQEVVARMRSRGRVGHHLVGLGIEGTLPAHGAPLTLEGKKVGEVTSAVRSPDCGDIALAFVRRGHHEPGTALAFDGGTAAVRALPFRDGTGNGLGAGAAPTGPEA